MNSRDKGAATLRAELESYSSCAIRPIVLLVGYSQGADVIGTALGGSLTSTTRSQIKGAVMFGDPSYRPNMAINAPGMNPGGIGTFGRTAAQNSTLNSMKTYGWNIDTNSMGYRQVVRSYCRDNDMFCQTNLFGLAIHKDYSAYMNNAAAFLNNFLFQG